MTNCRRCKHKKGYHVHSNAFPSFRWCRGDESKCPCEEFEEGISLTNLRALERLGSVDME